jgi:hypothetical protein
MEISVCGWNGFQYDGYFKFYLKTPSGQTKIYNTYNEDSFTDTVYYTLQSNDPEGYWLSYIYYYNIVTRRNTLLGTDNAFALNANGDYDSDGLTSGQEVNTYGTDPLDPDTDNDGLNDGPEITHATNPFDPDTDDDGFSDGDEVLVMGTDPLGIGRWAIIVCGGNVANDQQAGFEADSDLAYQVLIDLGYAHNNIMYLSSEDGVNPGRQNVDQLSTFQNLQNTIQTWLCGISDADDTVLIYLRDHGDQDDVVPDIGLFVLNADELLEDGDLDQWLDASVVCARMIVVVDCCYSGNWIHGVGDIAGVNRVVVAGCAPHTVQYSVWNGERLTGVFASRFWPLIAEGDAVEQAFATVDADPWVQQYQDPQINDQCNPPTNANGWVFP